MTKSNRELKAELIINDAASRGASSFSKSSIIPMFGPGLFGMKLLDQTIKVMIMELGELFYKELTYGDADWLYNTGFSSIKNTGRQIAAGIPASVPFLGWLSTLATGDLIENSVKVVGWATYFLLKDYKFRIGLSADECKVYLQKAEEKVRTS